MEVQVLVVLVIIVVLYGSRKEFFESVVRLTYPTSMLQVTCPPTPNSPFSENQPVRRQDVKSQQHHYVVVFRIYSCHQTASIPVPYRTGARTGSLQLMAQHPWSNRTSHVQVRRTQNRGYENRFFVTQTSTIIDLEHLPKLASTTESNDDQKRTHRYRY